MDCACDDAVAAAAAWFLRMVTGWASAPTAVRNPTLLFALVILIPLGSHCNGKISPPRLSASREAFA